MLKKASVKPKNNDFDQFITEPIKCFSIIYGIVFIIHTKLNAETKNLFRVRLNSI